MLCSGKFGLRLLFLVWCATASSAEQSNDDDVDIFEDIVSSGSNDSNNTENGQKLNAQSNDDDVDIFEDIVSSGSNDSNNTENGQKFDISVKRDELQKKLYNLLTPIGSKTEDLKAILDKTFENISNRIENKTVEIIQSDPDANQESCECVEIWMCKNSTRNQYGTYIIQPRSLYVKEVCKYNQICCYKSDMIEKSPEPELLDRMQDCGIRNVNGVELAIAGDKHLEANFGEFPWMIGILEKDNLIENLIRNIGGGSLLAPNVVLTAAHKVADKLPNTLIARAGEWDETTTDEIYICQDLDVEQIITHYQFQYKVNNIALLVLKGSFKPSPHISPICLPRSNQNFDHSGCIVTGWGKRRENSTDYPHILKKITMPLVHRNECTDKIKIILGPRFYLEQTSICAGGEKDVDACFGDGGAPLICPIRNSPNRYYQAGIVAWGIGCGKENVPGVYTDVPRFNSWINSELKKLNVDSKYYTA
ncbi:phenoloxidase-activating factor 2-like [Drosophila innubila]|uniref:phenoloxidase-activating factor 2-like n=1 Tax=Drosophila innubila TaxID=198719 RepID=UPI00148C0F4A|nr:phenoloxidase-activating factor 2-like [Drosophila innubila]